MMSEKEIRERLEDIAALIFWEFEDYPDERAELFEEYSKVSKEARKAGISSEEINSILTEKKENAHKWKTYEYEYLQDHPPHEDGYS